MENEMKMDRQAQFKIDKTAFKKRSLFEIMLETTKLLRGIIFRFKIDSVDGLLRVDKGVRILKKDAFIKLGRKVQLHRGVKLSAWGSNERTEIIIGDNTSIGDRTEIHAAKSVKIGAGCNIAWDVCIMDRDYHKFNSCNEIVKPIIIEDNVWIGCNSILLKGIIVGQGSVIAAGSVVTKNVPAKCLVGGNPAKILKEDIYWLP
jgi:acetyltransferase-like isoleucine patch superfamily enzyme